MRYKRYFVLFIIMILISLSLPAQVSVLPDDDFYTDATGWMLKGYIDNLPQLKPYPVNVVSGILETVIENGSPVDRQRAEFYRDKFFSRPFHVSSAFSSEVKLKQVDNGGTESTKKYEDDELLSGKLFFSGDVRLGSIAGIGFHSGGFLRNNNVNYNNINPKFSVGNVLNTVRPLCIETEKLDFILDPNVVVAVGNSNIYGTAGINRTGYGLFHDDSLILNSSAYQTLNATFNYINEHFSYSQLFGMLGARNYCDSDKFSGGKYLSFHSLRIPFPKKNITFSFYESVVFGKGFMPSYIMPVPYFIMANVSGFNENVLSGLKIEWKPVPCIMLSADAVFDDFDPKKILKLKLNDAAVRTGFKTGFVYSPLNSPCDFISVDYTLVTPYTYTKYNTRDENYNFLDYTNFGQNLGSNLLPNSDRVSMTIRFKPKPNLKISTISSLTRHANSYESLDDDDVVRLSGYYYSDGGLFMDTQGLSSAISSTDFLKQGNVMYVIHAALAGEYEVITSKLGRLGLSMRYTFEYIKNDGVDNSIFSGKYTEDDKNNGKIKNDRESWEASLHDSYNHYFTVGVKYSY